MLLKDKVVIISGVLGDIANYSLSALKENGAYIIGFDKREPTEQNYMQYIDEFYRGDVMDDKFLNHLKNKCSSKVDVIINNIGKGASKSFLKITDEEIIDSFQINCLSAIRLTRIFLQDMMSNEKGSIINFSSILSQHPVPTITHYSTSKSALVGFTKSLAVEIAPYNVRVNALLLGYSDTKNNEAYFASENGKNFIKRFIPTKKLVNKKQIGYLLTYLASDFSESVTGSTITIDRGYSIW